MSVSYGPYHLIEDSHVERLLGHISATTGTTYCIATPQPVTYELFSEDRAQPYPKAIRTLSDENVRKMDDQNTAITKNMSYLCFLCDRYFGSSEALEQHRNKSLAHKKSIRRETCDRVFGSREAHEQHKQNSHVQKKPFRCEICNGFFTSSEALKNHERKFCTLQISLQQSPNVSLGPQLESTVLSNTRAGHQNLDMQSLIIKRYNRILASVNPVTVASFLELLGEITAQPTQETREFFTYPELHQNIAEAVFPEIPSAWFQEDESEERFRNEWFTHVMGIFICTDSACNSQLWVSRKVSIEIRGYDKNGYNAFVYNQRCKSCDELGTFVLDKESYVERVAYRLKKWAGVIMPLPYYRSKEGLPHEHNFCEGCKRGKCREGGRSVF